MILEQPIYEDPMKPTLLFISLMIVFLCSCRTRTLENSHLASTDTVWELEGFDAPESAYYSASHKLIFVSNVAGGPGDKDKKGWISTVSPDGKLIKEKWVSGLNAPKGLRSHKGILWVADIDELVGINIKLGKILERRKISGAKMLNDVAIDTLNGSVFVSDTMSERIYKYNNGKVTVFAKGEELEHPNGLLIQPSGLIVASWGKGMGDDWSTKIPGTLFSLDLSSKKKQAITKEPLGNLDGVEIYNNDYIVSDWSAGKVYQVTKKGEVSLLLSGLKGAADLGLVIGKKLLIVPAMSENKVRAYKLK